MNIFHYSLLSQKWILRFHLPLTHWWDQLTSIKISIWNQRYLHFFGTYKGLSGLQIQNLVSITSLVQIIWCLAKMSSSLPPTVQVVKVSALDQVIQLHEFGMFQTFIILSQWMQKRNTFKIYKMQLREGERERERMRQRKYNLNLKNSKLKIYWLKVGWHFNQKISGTGKSSSVVA